MSRVQARLWTLARRGLVRPGVVPQVSTRVKLVGANSSLRVDADWAEQALAAIVAVDAKVILHPLAVGGRYLVDQGEGLAYAAPDLPQAQTLWESVEASEVPRWMAEVGAAASQDLWAASRWLPLELASHERRYEHLASTASRLLGEWETAQQEYCPACVDWLQAAFDQAPEPGRCDSVGHADLHPGNVLIDAGRIRVIDLENLIPAPAFTDLLYVATWARRAPEVWAERVAEHEALVGRPPGRADLLTASAITIVQASLSPARSAVRYAAGSHWLLHHCRDHWVD